MTKSFIDNELDFTLQQMIGESYWQNYWNNIKSGFYNGKDPSIQQADFILTARYGNTKIRSPNNGGDGIDPTTTPNTTKITDEQANYLYNKYDIVDYKDSDASGFSAMLLKNKTTGEYTWNIRSAEFVEDQARDGFGGADWSITTSGFSVAQIAAMEKILLNLKV